MMVKAKDLWADMIIELEMMASYHARKKMVTKLLKLRKTYFIRKAIKK